MAERCKIYDFRCRIKGNSSQVSAWSEELEINLISKKATVKINSPLKDASIHLFGDINVLVKDDIGYRDLEALINKIPLR